MRRTLSQLPPQADQALRYEGEALVTELQGLLTLARGILERAIQANQFGAAMAGVRELARIFELIAKLTGQLDESARVNVAVIQQQQAAAEQEIMLERLTVAERLELRRLVAKAQGESGTPPSPCPSAPTIPFAATPQGHQDRLAAARRHVDDQPP
ncbi:MAG: hypothetical protein JO166_12975 [Deltaproteobacteria bacterium]|nr:hypothetical protein [Deltaproteobacteria bacterium]